MAECNIDAIKIAKAIQEDELSILDGKEFKMNVKIKKRKRMKKTRKGNKYTLADIAKDLAKLNQKVDNLTNDVKDINIRLDGVEARLDYNGLQIESIQKRLDYNGLQIESIQKRLDYNGQQIEGIQKRLDYNGLKKLPESSK